MNRNSTIQLIATLSIACALTMAPAIAAASVTCATVSDRKDDAEEKVSNGSVSNDSSDLDLDDDKIVGMRFRNLPIPQGATISYAYISFIAEESDSNYTWLRLFGEDHNDAKNFDNNDEEITDRPLTDAFMDWVPSSWTTGAQYFTPPLTAIVQEIVDRPGWSLGNDLAIIVHGYDGHREAESYDGSAADAPQLCVYY